MKHLYSIDLLKILSIHGKAGNECSTNSPPDPSRIRNERMFPEDEIYGRDKIID